MGGPWERYQTAAPLSQESDGPWSKYKNIPYSEPAQPEESFGRKFTRSTIDTVLPVAGAVAAGLVATPESAGLMTIPAGAAGYAGGKQAARILNHYILGDDIGEQNIPGLVKQTAGDLKTGALMEMGGQVLAKPISYVGEKLGGIAEKLAVKSTGATGSQASKFNENAGRELLDRGLVKFGDKAANVAERTAAAHQEANDAIDEVLTKLDAKGVKASADNVVAQLESKISSLEKNASKAGVVRKLKTIIEDIHQTGESNVPISTAEETKRGFNEMAGNWADKEAGQAGKEAYQAYRKEVENTATAADPELGKKFIESKKTYGLISPIKEAAGRRAMQQNQSQIGDLGDLVAAGVGGVKGFVAKKLLQPRIASSLAITADSISSALVQNPEFAQLAKKSPAAFQSIVEQIENKYAAPQVQSVLPRAAKNEPTKGPEKWANDGAKKVIEHDSSISPEIIEKLKETQKGKDLLIKASDLTPGSKAMEQILSKIKSSSMNGGE